MSMKKVSCLLMLLATANLAAQDSIRKQLAGRPVDLTLVRADDLSPAQFPPESIDLAQVSAKLAADTNVFLLLQANGIAPDSEAFTLVYDLNSNIQSVDTLPPDSSILLPSIVGGPALRALLQRGYLVELTIDSPLRHELNQRIEDLHSLAPHLNQVSQDATTQLQLTDLLAWYDQIEKRFKRRTDPPLRRDTLAGMNDEAGALLSILKGAIRQRKQLDSTQLAQIHAIYDDIKDDISQYNQVLSDTAPPAQPGYLVTVNILGGPPALTDTLRVYYTPNGLFRPLPADPPVISYSFEELGSGKSRVLGRKNYDLWAAADGDSNHPLTVTYTLTIDNASPQHLTVDLSIQKARNE
jgi:hypothetical protein